MIARDTYKFYLSTAETHLILRALRELSENNDVRKPEKDSIMSLMNSMKLDIRAQEAEDE
jgi:hypothetical protein